jgi:hypothetical protein
MSHTRKKKTRKITKKNSRRGGSNIDDAQVVYFNHDKYIGYYVEHPLFSLCIICKAAEHTDYVVAKVNDFFIIISRFTRTETPTEIIKILSECDPIHCSKDIFCSLPKDQWDKIEFFDEETIRLQDKKENYTYMSKIYNEPHFMIKDKFYEKLEKRPNAILHNKYWIVDRTNKLSSQLPPPNYGETGTRKKHSAWEGWTDADIDELFQSPVKKYADDEGNTSAESSQFSSTSSSIPKSNKKTHSHPIHLNKSQSKSISPHRRTIRKPSSPEKPEEQEEPDKESSSYY